MCLWLRLRPSNRYGPRCSLAVWPLSSGYEEKLAGGLASFELSVAMPEEARDMAAIGMIGQANIDWPSLFHL